MARPDAVVQTYAKLGELVDRLEALISDESDDATAESDE